MYAFIILSPLLLAIFMNDIEPWKVTHATVALPILGSMSFFDNTPGRRSERIQEKDMNVSARSALALAASVFLLWGCASTQLTNAWKDSRYEGPPLGKIVVIGVTKQSAVRRIFEDVFSAALRTHGVEATPSYTLIPEDGEVPKARLAAAVEQSGADGVLMMRLVKVDRQTQIYPGSYTGAPFMGFYGFYSSAWLGFYDPPQVYTYDVMTSETLLFEARDNRLLWSGTTETFSPRDVRKDTQDFASVIIKALAEQGLIAKSPKASG